MVRVRKMYDGRLEGWKVGRLEDWVHRPIELAKPQCRCSVPPM